MNKTLPIFLVYAKRKNTKEQIAHIYLRISYQTDVVDRGTGVHCLYEQWQSHDQVIRDNPVGTHQLKEFLTVTKNKIMGAYYILKQSSPQVSLREIVAVALDEEKAKVFSVYTCFEGLIEKMIHAKGKGVSQSNIQKHQICLKHLRSFVTKEYKWNDFPFNRINRSFVDGFIDYMKTETGCCHNTAIKHLSIFKKIYKMALDNQWIRYNAFSGYRMSIKPVQRIILTEEEINQIAEKELHIKRLDFVKDLFVFSCFSGLAYIDLANLKRRNIENNMGISWIKIRREKTGIDATIPLLLPPLKILDKWSPGWKNFPADTVLFKSISNQKTNAYLKEIADLCGISKKITFHIARHSFATSIALCNNIPMETVSKMLGHSRITMTQHYSKVIDSKMLKDSGFLIGKYG